MKTKNKRFSALKCFFEILRESLWGLVKLNLLFILTCLPIITLGPSLAALSGCITKLIQGDLLEKPAHTYLKLFRDSFRRAFLWGLFTLISGAVLGNALLYYGSRIGENAIFIPATSLTLVAILFLWGILMHLYPLLAEGAQKNLFRTAADHAARRMGQTLLAILISVLLLGAQYLFFPASAPLPIMIGLVIPALVCGIACKNNE